MGGAKMTKSERNRYYVHRRFCLWRKSSSHPATKGSKSMIPMSMVLLIAVFLSTGCSIQRPHGRAGCAENCCQPVTRPGRRHGATAAPVYTYNPQGKRDPFAPIIVKEDKKANLADRPPLEQYNVYDFKFAGVIWGGFGYNAMLEGPDGKGYLVRVGTIIGPNKGVWADHPDQEGTRKIQDSGTDRKEIIVISGNRRCL
jgi:hypothetical protein